MEAALWAAKTGLDAQQTQMTVTANNLANVATTGFKSSRGVFEDLLYQNVSQVGANTSQTTQSPSGLQLGTGVRVVATETVNTQGSLNQTNNSLDLAIQGRGYFQVLLPSGTLAYTRDGSFQVTNTGQVVTAAGLSHPARHDHSNRHAECHDRHRRYGEHSARRSVFPHYGRNRTARRLHQPGGSAEPGRQPPVRVGLERCGHDRHPGCLRAWAPWYRARWESSNVNVVEEMVNMIQIQRAYEMNSKAVQTCDQMLQYADQNM